MIDHDEQTPITRDAALPPRHRHELLGYTPGHPVAVMVDAGAPYRVVQFNADGTLTVEDAYVKNAEGKRRRYIAKLASCVTLVSRLPYATEGRDATAAAKRAVPVPRVKPLGFTPALPRSVTHG